MPNKKVAILTCGGTIAMGSGRGLKVKHSGRDLIKQFPSLETLADIEVDEVMEKDSANIGPKDWQTLAKKAYDYVLRDDISGVVVVHGTDTLEYTSFALALMIHSLNKPLVFTGTQVPAEKGMHHAERHLYDSVFTAANSGINNVVICFSGDPASTFTNLYRASTAVKAKTHDYDAFTSWDGPIASVANRKLIYNLGYNNPAYVNFNELNIDLEENVAITEGGTDEKMETQMINTIIKSGMRGIIFRTNKDSYSPYSEIGSREYKMIARALNAGLVVGICSKDTGPVTLRTERKHDLLSNGAVPLARMPWSKAIVKLRWVLAQTNDQERAGRMLAYDYCGEIPMHSYQMHI